jgi:alcohol dehydrogenase class IV
MPEPLVPFEFRLPTALRFQPGAAEHLGEICRDSGYSSAFVVVDPGLHRLGAADAALASLEAAGIDVELWTNLQPNPVTDDMEAAASAFDRREGSLVIGIGGGSALDTAKGVAVLATNGGKLRDYAGNGQVPNRCWPLLLVPTTAGTGSEVSASISVTDAATHDKLAVRDPNNCAWIAVLDPTLLTGLPAVVAAHSAMDALTHAVESYVSRRSMPMSRLFAYEAARLINQSIEPFVADRTDPAHGANMLYGSALAGAAMSHTGTGNAHAVSRALGGRYGVIHGLGCAVALEPVMRFNVTAAEQGYAELAEAFGVRDPSATAAENAARTVERVAEIRAHVWIPQRLDLIVPTDDLPGLVRWTVENSTPNPRTTDDADARELLLAVVAS